MKFRDILCFILGVLLTTIFLYKGGYINNFYEKNKEQIVATLQIEYGISKAIAIAIYNSHRISKFDPIFLAELISSESQFNIKARSCKNYKGLMQTPTMTGDPDVDVLYGTKILMEKWEIAKGDPLKAVALYKGGWNKQAIKYAKEMLRNYRTRVSKLSEVINET